MMISRIRNLKIWKIPLFLQNHGLGLLIPDKLYIKSVFKSVFGYELDLKNPKTFNEKLQWLKLFDRKPEYTIMVDKAEVKHYVSDFIGEECVIRTLKTYNSVAQIDFSDLPNQFVLKCTHDSGGIVICKDKSCFNEEIAREKLQKSLDRNYYLLGREWPYKKVRHRIIAEEYISEIGGQDILDYKVHCFNGKAKFILVCSDRFSPCGLREDFFDVDWNHLEIRRPDHPCSERAILRPPHLSQMISIAEKIAEQCRFVRVDFYDLPDKLLFGEITFFPASGFAKFEPDEIDKQWGDLITLFD